MRLKASQLAVEQVSSFCKDLLSGITHAAEKSGRKVEEDNLSSQSQSKPGEWQG